MQDATCQFCGNKFKSFRDRKKFCSMDCYNKHRETLVAQGINAWQQTLCRYNEGVACEDHQCDNCGWNPAVVQKRSEAMV